MSKSKVKYSVAFKIAFEALMANKVRSMLTALGMIFGVAAVISMMAIGKGAEREIMEQIKLVGVNNIVITKKVKLEMEGDAQESSPTSSAKKKNLSAGLNLLDVQAIEKTLPNLDAVSPLLEYEVFTVRNGISGQIKIMGVNELYMNMYSYKLLQGKMFTAQASENYLPVCVIGKNIKTRYFQGKDPIGERIKCGGVWYTVLGVFSFGDAATSEASGVRDFNNEILIPIETLLNRFKNRGLVNKFIIKQADKNDDDEKKTEDKNKEKGDYHQLDKIIVQVANSKKLKSTAEVLSRMLKRRHSGVQDFEIEVPELLLKQQQKSKELFNIVLGIIAGISLIVGGIGIMNIMLASVMERIKEIGLRISLGATKADIINQFLFEGILLSVGGGLTGVVLGIIMSILIAHFTGILTIVTFQSILISFGISASVGMIFGLMPARKAANQDPVTSLRN